MYSRCEMKTAPKAWELIVLLLKITNAKKTIEIGVFIGYSVFLTVLIIPDDGKASASQLKFVYNIFSNWCIEHGWSMCVNIMHITAIDLDQY